MTCALFMLVIATVAVPTAASETVGRTTRDYRVPTRHGVLYLEVEHPTRADGSIVAAPEILTYSPYAFALGRNADAGDWVPRGYARATADLLGIGNSGGCWDYGGIREKESGYDLVEWIAAQPWSTGKVGMIGGSYEGTTATATATQRPPHLSTIVPDSAVSRWYEYAFSGGIRYSGNSERPADEGVDTPLAVDFGLALPPPIDVADSTWAERTASAIRPCDEVQHNLHGYDLDTPSYDAFWLERDYIVDAGKIDIPVLVASNWGDWNVKQEQGINLYRALVNAPVKRLYMGSRFRGHEEKPSSGFLRPTVAAWLDHYLLGDANGVPHSVSEVTSEMADDSGSLAPHYSGPWPATADVTLFAGADVTDPDYPWKLSPKSPRPPHQPKPALFGFTTGTHTEAAANSNPRANTQWFWFESDPLAHDLRIFGNIEVRLWSTVGRRWITYTPTIVDINPADRQVAPIPLLATSGTRLHSVTRGWLDSRYRRDPSTLLDVVPGESFGMRVVEKPQDYTFRENHLIGLVVQTEIDEWSMPKAYADCTSADCATVRIDWEEGKTKIVLPVVDAPADAAALFRTG